MNTANQSSILTEVIRSFQDAFNATDLSQVVQAYAPDGVLLPNNGPAAQGQPAIEAVYRALFNSFAITITYTIEQHAIEGDLAWVRTSSQVVTRVQASGELIALENKDLFVLRRQQGAWKIAHYIFNNTAKHEATKLNNYPYAIRHHRLVRPY